MKNITSKIIITDTNIITDLNNAELLDIFVNLDNVYICDMLEYELNSKTGNLKIIKNFKTLPTTPQQVEEITQLQKTNPSLSIFDIINFIIARDNNGILATGDKKLGEFAQSNNIKVIRTLKIIKELYLNESISKEKAVNACNLLKNNKQTRIPEEKIDETIKEIENT